MQGWAAGSVKMNRTDERRWDPGFSTGNRKVWDIGKLKEEEYNGMEKNDAPKTAWNGF